LKSHEHITNWCAPWKFAIDTEKFVLHALQFHLMDICGKSQNWEEEGKEKF
jgi:hypothetical protein